MSQLTRRGFIAGALATAAVAPIAAAESLTAPAFMASSSDVQLVSLYPSSVEIVWYDEMQRLRWEIARSFFIPSVMLTPREECERQTMLTLPRIGDKLSSRAGANSVFELCVDENEERE